MGAPREFEQTWQEPLQSQRQVRAIAEARGSRAGCALVLSCPPLDPRPEVADLEGSLLQEKWLQEQGLGAGTLTEAVAAAFRLPQAPGLSGLPGFRRNRGGWSKSKPSAGSKDQELAKRYTGEGTQASGL